MFKPKPKSKLQIEIDKLVLALADHKPEEEKYGTIADRLSKLKKLESETREPSRQFPIPSGDTVLLALTNLIGIYMIIRHENVNVITSKAVGFVKRP